MLEDELTWKILLKIMDHYWSVILLSWFSIKLIFSIFLMTVLHFLHTFQIFEILRCIIYIPSAVDLLCDIIEIKQFIILIFLTQNLHTPLYLILSSVYPPVIYCNRGCVCFLLKTNTVTCVLDFTSLFPSQGLLIISIVLYWIFNSSIPYHLNMI